MPFIEFVLTFQCFLIVVVTNSYVQRLTAFFDLDQVSSPATPGQSSSSVLVNFFFLLHTKSLAFFNDSSTCKSHPNLSQIKNGP